MAEKVMDIERELEGIVKEFRETIRELRMERSAMMITLMRISFDPTVDARKLAGEVLQRVEEFRPKPEMMDYSEAPAGYFLKPITIPPPPMGTGRKE